MSVIDFFKEREKRIAENIRVSMIARVERYDDIRKRADVTPRGMPMIQNALVLEHITLQRGDNVLIVFSDTALDNSSQQRHRLDDAIVVGKVRL